MSNTVWHENSTNINYIEIDDVEGCHDCNDRILDLGYLILDFNKKNGYYYYYCINCINNNSKSIFEQRQEIPFMVVENRPKGCVPFLTLPVGYQSSKGMVSTFDIAKINRLGGETIDKTKYAGRTHYLNKHNKTQSQIDAEVLLQLEETDKKLSLDVGMQLLDKVLEESRVQIEDKAKEALEYAEGSKRPVPV